MRRPKGTRDLLGEELAGIRHVESVMRGVFERYGYEEVETPTFEALELFTKRSGETVVKQLYAFKDRSGQELTLRPELTAPVIRLYIEKLRSAPKPVKLCYFGHCFRYEEPQAQRWRQFFQSGVEIIGSSKPETDAETIALADEVMRELGLERELRVGHARLLRELLTCTGVKGDAQDPLMRAIDSRDRARLEAELDRAGVSGKNRERLEELIAMRGDVDVLERAKNVVKRLPKAKDALENLGQILKFARALGAQGFSVDLGIARGLEYYTDAVFEFYVDGVQVAGGGRYDELIELLGGEPCPAVGIGFGIDRITRLLLKRGMRAPRPKPTCVVLPTTEAALEECFKVARDLRVARLPTDIDLMGRSLAKGLAYANAKKAAFAVIVGPRDLAVGKVTVRNMQTGGQKSVKREELVNRLKSVT